ncbi:hypothetical protein M885DRAFT_592008 [Pelagophyceae sp. CCMP2097]|nr:hypothetical protein M885DRAFT_592008 [Pelagophyceae sp. CCMP2097]
MEISDDEPPHDDAADDDESGAAEAIEVFSTWDPDTKVMRYRAYVAGATAPLNYKDFVSTAEEFEEKKAKRLKKELVEHIFACGHGNVAQTQLLLEAVFNDELGIRDFVATRKLSSVGGTYVTEKYIDLETIALATAASGGGPDVGVSASFMRRHEELLADVRRGPRQRRKDKLNTAIIAEFWHDSRVSRIDTFSKCLSSTPDCSFRSTALVSNKEAYNLFLKSPGLLEARARLKELGHKHYDKAFSYTTFIKFKCACIMQPHLRSCVCQKCQQMEYYFLAGCDYYVRRAKAQALKFSNLTLFGKARWLAPIRAFVCAGRAKKMGLCVANAMPLTSRAVASAIIQKNVL